jgi:hypothetical protein
MITSAQSVPEAGPLNPQSNNNAGSQHQFVPSLGSPEAELWGEVLLRAIEDFKTYMGYRKDPQEYPLSAKMVRSIVADGCDPEYWIFAKETGFSAVCMVLNVEPDCIRRFLRNWLKETHDMEPTY